MSGRTRPMTLALSVALGATMVSGAWMLQRGTAGEAISRVNGPRLLQQVVALVRDQYVDTLAGARIYGMTVDGVLGELDDPYDTYLTPTRLARLNERTSGSYAGIGLQVDVRDGALVVVNPLPGTPAERSGILTGDRIVEIDGKRVSGWTPDEVQRLLRGAPGTPVQVTIEHPGSATPITLHLVRAEIRQSAVRHPTMFAGRAAYVELGPFSDSTVAELTRTIDSLVRSGARSLVLDLRANPGGLLRQGVAVADLFLDRGDVVARTRGRDSSDNRTYVDPAAQRWPSLVLTVLVDDRTASAAEVVAGALQDHDRAAILGRPTYGKGSVQRVFALENHGALRLTTARWYTPAGRSISRVTDRNAEETGDTTPRPKFRTSGGRVVLGGGGIIPDLMTGDTTVPAENLALMHATGANVPRFRDALASFALDARAARSIQSPDFTVTREMLDDVYARMKARGVDIPRNVYDDAAPLVSRLLSYEIERYVFGAAAEFERKAADDVTLQTALRILRGSRSQSDVLARAARLARETSG